MLLSIDSNPGAWMLLFGRTLLATVFLVSGIHKAVWYQKAVTEFEAGGAPLVRVTLPATILLHLVAPICLVLGIYVAEAALALAVFTVLATFLVHGYWRFEGPDRLIRSRICTGNLAVAGGLLYVAAAGPGPLVFS